MRIDQTQLCRYDLDVAMAHPFNQDTLKQAALEEGFAAARREERKMIKYEKQQLARNTSSLNFTPLVFDVLELGDQKPPTI